MQVYSAHIKSVPFPKEGFQKWDVITPKDNDNYGQQYIITDYQRFEYDNGKIEYRYIINSHFGEIAETNLNKYEKLYSKKREISIKLQNNLKDDINHLLKTKNDIWENLNIDTNLINEGINSIKAFLKILAQIN